MRSARHASTAWSATPPRRTIPVTDEGLLRGDGVFEVVRALRRPAVRAGRAPATGWQRSAANLRLEIDLGALRATSTRCWPRPAPVDARAADARHARRPAHRADRAAPRSCPTTLALAPVTYAPTRVLDGVKSLCYAANMLATRLAQGARRRRGAARHAARPRAGGADVARSSTSLDGERLVHAAAERPHPRLDHAPPRASRVDGRAGARHAPATTSPRVSEAFLASTLREVHPVARDRRRELPAAPGPLTRAAADARRRARSRRSSPVRRGEGRHRHRQPPAVRQGGGGLAAAARASTTSCSSTPASTTTTSCRRSSSSELGVPRPERRAGHRTAAPTPSRPRGCSAALGPLLADAAPGPRCSSTATRTRRSPARWRRRRRGIPVAHVEAGHALVRPRDARGAQPRPHRPRSATCCCARRRRPSTTCAREAVAGAVVLVGDVMVDVAHAVPAARARDASRCARGRRARRLRARDRAPRRQRRRPARGCARSSTCCSRSRGDVVLPLHPRTARAAGGGRAARAGSRRRHVGSLPPLGYLDFTALLVPRARAS